VIVGVFSIPHIIREWDLFFLSVWRLIMQSLSCTSFLVVDLLRVIHLEEGKEQDRQKQTHREGGIWVWYITHRHNYLNHLWLQHSKGRTMAASRMHLHTMSFCVPEQSFTSTKLQIDQRFRRKGCNQSNLRWESLLSLSVQIKL
jgi:hypothetical protein